MITLSYSLSTLSVSIDFFKMLLDELRNFQRRKIIREKLFQALSVEIEAYLGTFENMAKLGEEQIIPLLQAITSSSSRHKIIQIVKCVTDLQVMYSRLLESFVNLAKGCKDVSSYGAFMKHLMEADYKLFDFVNVMANTVTDGTVLIDSKFYRFIKMHGNEVIEKVKNKDIDNAVKECKVYIDIINKCVKPNIHKFLLPKKTLRHLIDSYKKLGVASRKIKVRKTDIMNLRQYVPLKLLPIIVLFEESFPSLKQAV